MQLTVTVHHDFSSLDAIIEKLALLFGSIAFGEAVSPRAAAPAQAPLPVPSTEGAAGTVPPVEMPPVSIPPAPAPAEAPASVAPADAQPKRRGRPRKTPEPVATTPAAPVEQPAAPAAPPAAAPFGFITQPPAGGGANSAFGVPAGGDAASSAPAPVAAEPVSKDEERHLRERILLMVQLSGDQKYVEIRKNLGNPKIAELTREQYASFLKAVDEELAKHGQ